MSANNKRGFRRLNMKFGITKRNNSITSDPGAFRYGMDRLFDEFFNLKPVSG